MFGYEPYWHIGFWKESYANARYIPKRSQKIKNKRLRKRRR